MALLAGVAGIGAVLGAAVGGGGTYYVVSSRDKRVIESLKKMKINIKYTGCSFF